MSDSAETASFDAVPDEPARPVPASAGTSWSSAAESGGGEAEHPELFVGAAFVGGLLLASILKRLAR